MPIHASLIGQAGKTYLFDESIHARRVADRDLLQLDS